MNTIDRIVQKKIIFSFVINNATMLQTKQKINFLSICSIVKW